MAQAQKVQKSQHINASARIYAVEMKGPPLPPLPVEAKKKPAHAEFVPHKYPSTQLVWARLLIPNTI